MSTRTEAWADAMYREKRRRQLRDAMQRYRERLAALPPAPVTAEPRCRGARCRRFITARNASGLCARCVQRERLRRYWQARADTFARDAARSA